MSDEIKRRKGDSAGNAGKRDADGRKTSADKRGGDGARVKTYSVKRTSASGARTGAKSDAKAAGKSGGRTAGKSAEGARDSKRTAQGYPAKANATRMKPAWRTEKPGEDGVRRRGESGERREAPRAFQSMSGGKRPEWSESRTERSGAKGAAKAAVKDAKTTKYAAKDAKTSAKMAKPAAKDTKSAAKTAKPAAKDTKSAAKTAKTPAKAVRPAGRTSLPGADGVRRVGGGERREIPHGAGKREEGSGDGPRGVAPARGPALSARDAALRALQDVVRGDAFASEALSRRLQDARLKDDDRRLAASLFYFAVENRLYLEYMLGRFLEQRPEPVVNDILHIAAAQLLFMDRVPDHAAVDEAVKQVRAARREGATGLVNGVLRNLIRARDAGELTLPDRDADPVRWLSVKCSLAEPAARRLIDAYGLEAAEAIAGYAPSRREQTIRPNKLVMTAEAFEAWLTKQGYAWRRGDAADAYIVENAEMLANTPGYREGLFSIQGQSAMLAAQAVTARPGMQILDACAAPGGKTCLMAEAMGTSGRVFAWDVYPHRVELIRAAVKRLGLDNVRPSERDARKPAPAVKLSMDAVLVDAPCSGLGVIADKPDSKYRQTEESLSALPKVQREILDACAGAVKVGGLLVYATCTVLPEENEAQVAAFLERHPEFAPDADDRWLPERLRVLWKNGRIQLLPHRDGLEGFFIARLRRKGV